MTTLHAIHFPETTLPNLEILGQSLLFDEVSHITATADTESADSLSSAYDPAPLGNDAERFNQLLSELKGNETAFYQGQMSSLALEYLETRNDDTVRDIITAVHGEQLPKKTPAEVKEYAQLWQARLLLKLAEILRKEEQEVHNSLQRIKDAQEDMLGDLKGEEDFQDIFHAVHSALPNRMPMRVESLIKAWGQLFSQGNKPFDALHCLSPDAAEPFMEINEAMTGKRPVRLLRLPLPNCAASPDEFSAKKEQWCTENDQWLTELKTALHAVCTKGLTEEVSLADFSQYAGKWTAQIEQTTLWPSHLPAKRCGPPALEIYLLEKDIPSLVSKLCNLPKKSMQGMPNSLLAVVSSRPNTCN